MMESSGEEGASHDPFPNGRAHVEEEEEEEESSIIGAHMCSRR